MAKSMTSTSITNMARIIEDAQRQGYTVVSGKKWDVGASRLTYAFYALKRHDLYDTVDDCYFTARLSHYGSVIYKPLTNKEYHADEV